MITLVIPWYGPDTVGGAETQARSLARALRRIGVPVRVWTSTGRDSFHPQSQQYYPRGADELDGIPIWRFSPTLPSARGIPRFFDAHPHLLPPLDRFAAHEMRLLGSLLSSDELYEAVWRESERGEQDHCFIFMPYVFPTTFWGALLAPRQSFVLPCLHDEPYARYHTYSYLFSQVRGILCNSYPEASLAQRLYPISPNRIHVAGEGIDLLARGDGEAFRKRWFPHLVGTSTETSQAERTPPSHTAPSLLLYVGRRDESKNFWLMLAYVREYWARRGWPMRLLVAGRNPIDLPRHLAPLVWDLGYLGEQEKHDAYAAADVFLQPSRYESFSIVLMEAWLQGTPALVYGECAVTADHCRRSGGGLCFTDFCSFAAALDLLLMNPNLRHLLGERGRSYVMETCDWDAVARRTARAVGLL